ncbi:hypothetical protein BU25DRAFT_4643 [Macroventuria anomochaeta]|uniref:Uncharacterized protein n=1 Tax=Macroventuria anomochaeta TaxID=301207 RepID=A0ACB6SH78_9PLEO|nr:uncharacterized protein BU25DRAFT_4643 [Macroventuria anomochaeta]KAF2633379.1 hypothetical protein BU25DRAFT_4643 [Macroventuria anomochaeta]
MQSAAVGEVHADAGERHVSVCVVFLLMFVGTTVWVRGAFAVPFDWRFGEAGAATRSRERLLCNQSRSRIRGGRAAKQLTTMILPGVIPVPSLDSHRQTGKPWYTLIEPSPLT